MDETRKSFDVTFCHNLKVQYFWLPYCIILQVSKQRVISPFCLSFLPCNQISYYLWKYIENKPLNINLSKICCEELVQIFSLKVMLHLRITFDIFTDIFFICLNEIFNILYFKSTVSTPSICCIILQIWLSGTIFTRTF